MPSRHTTPTHTSPSRIASVVPRTARAHLLPRLSTAALVCLLGGCVGLGSIDDGPAGNGPTRPGSESETGPAALVSVPKVRECEQRSVPVQPLRRLSSTQYANTLRDLFGADLAAPMLQDAAFPATTIKAGFRNDAEANTVNTSESLAIEDNAARIASILLEDPARYVLAWTSCGLSAGYSEAQLDACIDDFVTSFGLRAFRRPLTDAEVAIARGLYQGLRSEQGANEAFVAVVQFFVQSPALLYRTERGADQLVPGLQRLSDYEMASRLSYFLLDSMPDAELFEAAAAGELSTPAQVQSQARRLIEGPDFERVLAGFHRDWLRLYELEEGSKSATAFPSFTTAQHEALLAETGELLRWVMNEAGGTLHSLLTTSTLPVNAPLAGLYGVDAPAGTSDDTWQPAEVPHRAGLFSTASFMASHAGSEVTNPIHRGAFFQREVLCNVLPTLPGDVDTQGPLQDSSQLPTARQRLAPLMDPNNSCSGCHQLFNPTGLALENYDALGRFRSEENGAPIDAAGQLVLDGVSHDFAAPEQLTRLIGESQQAQDCYALQWYRAALGRREFAEDSCSLTSVRQALDDAGGDLRELIVALTQTDGFLYRAPVDS